jgi:hypothetical protein
MKQFLLGCFLILLAAPSFSQVDCMADSTFVDSMAGVYPLPYDLITNPEGGIPDSACLNKYYEFSFTAVVNDTLTLGSQVFVLDSLVLPTDDAVTGMPEGFNFACNPPDCVFEQNSIGCVILYGKATNSADLGDNLLSISGTLWSQGFPIPLTFPNPLLFPGTYSLYVHEEDYPNCLVINDTEEQALPLEGIRNYPNPFQGTTTIELNSTTADDYTFRVMDLFGKVVHQEQVNFQEGTNRMTFDAANFANGVYLYSFSNEKGNVTKKMVISGR